MVVLTKLCTTLALITVTNLLLVPTDLVTCTEDGVQLRGNLSRRATGTSTRSCPGDSYRGRFTNYTPFYILLLKGDIAQRKGDNAT